MNEKGVYLRLLKSVRFVCKCYELSIEDKDMLKQINRANEENLNYEKSNEHLSTEIDIQLQSTTAYM